MAVKRQQCSKGSYAKFQGAKLNMEGIVDSWTKYLHSANEALQKVKKHLLQLIQTLGEKIDEQRDLSSKQALNEICDSLREYGKRNQDFNDLMEMFDKLEDETTELRKKQTHTDVDYLVQILEKMIKEAPEFSQFDEEFRSAVRAFILSRRSLNQVRDMGEFVKFKDELHHLAETGRQMGGDVGEVVNVNNQLNDLIHKLALPNQGGNLGEVVNVAHQFNDLAETLLKSLYRAIGPMEVDDLVQSSEGKSTNSTKAPEIAQFAQEFRNAATSSVNLGLEVLSMFDHNRNTTAESLQTLNEILEELKNAGHVSWSPPVFSSKSWSSNLGLQECIGWTDGMHS